MSGAEQPAAIVPSGLGGGLRLSSTPWIEDLEQLERSRERPASPPGGRHELTRHPALDGPASASTGRSTQWNSVRLAEPVRADHAEYLARVTREGDPVHGGGPPNAGDHGPDSARRPRLAGHSLLQPARKGCTTAMPLARPDQSAMMNPEPGRGQSR